MRGTLWFVILSAFIYTERTGSRRISSQGKKKYESIAVKVIALKITEEISFSPESKMGEVMS